MKELSEREIAAIVNGIPQTNLALFAPGLHGHGATLKDRSPYANHGTITSPAWKGSPRGFPLMGYGSSVDFGDAASLRITNNLSVIIWDKTPASFPTGAQWSYDNTFGKIYSATSQRQWFIGKVNPLSGTLAQCYFAIALADDGSGSQYQAYYNSALTAGTWYMVGFTLASGVFVAYLNGVAVAMTQRAGTHAIPNPLFDGTAAVAIPRQGFLISSGGAALPMVWGGSPVLTATQFLQIYTRTRHLLGV